MHCAPLSSNPLICYVQQDPVPVLSQVESQTQEYLLVCYLYSVDCRVEVMLSWYMYDIVVTLIESSYISINYTIQKPAVSSPCNVWVFEFIRLLHVLGFGRSHSIPHDLYMCISYSCKHTSGTLNFTQSTIIITQTNLGLSRDGYEDVHNFVDFAWAFTVEKCLAFWSRVRFATLEWL